ncbi:hypothetical protein [Chryseobacterium sp. SIMBA_038]|uniref:hypothetical protein n=1 Tax=Chryseobacterium sp. SIMBA_038 TaxID=3085780 RepID=UPI00397B5790
MKSIFNNTNFSTCLSTITDEVFYICDDGGVGIPCRISDSTSYDFKVINPKNKKIDFTKIDSCVYHANDGRKCDFLLNDDTIACFIEIKSLTDFSNSWKSDSKKDDALDQIIETIKKIKLRFPTISLIHIYGIICLKPNLPTFTQSIQVAEQVRINKLLTETGCPNLFIGNELTFSN